MAGHSKWANIKRHKAKQDAKRGKLYTKIIRELTVAASGGGDANANPRLRAALDKAQQANMTKDVIERAIKRGTGALGADSLEEIRYEGYGPGGIAVMVDCMTNNRNRTVADVRHAFTKHEGNLGTNGSVAYLFKKQGQITIAEVADIDRLMEIALDAGASDIIMNDDHSADVLTTPDNFLNIKEALKAGGFAAADAEITMLAEANVSIDDKEVAEKVVNLIDALEDLDDVQSVYTNADIVSSVLNEM